MQNYPSRTKVLIFAGGICRSLNILTTSMEVTFQYTPKLLQRAHQLHYRKFFLFQSRRPVILGFMAIWAGVLLYLILGENGNKFLSLSLVVFGVMAIGIYFWMIRTIGKRVYKKLKNYHEPIPMQIGDESILMTIGGETYEMPWIDIKKAVINNGLILLYPTERVFYIFYKDHFKEGQFDQFEEWVRQRVTHIF